MERKSSAITFAPTGRTKQSFKDECDINFMLRNYQQGGILPPVNNYPARFGDFTNVPDLHGALNQVREAEAAFGQLPALTRKRFGNDAGELLEFLADPNNAEEAAELGLIDRADLPAGEHPADTPATTPDTPPDDPSPDPTPE